MKRLSTEWLSVCGGCHVSILDIHEKIHRILKVIEIVHSPILTDIKDFPDADLGILSGAIRSEHDRRIAEKMRKSCKMLIAFGTCAVFGGISGAGSIHTKDEMFDAVYRKNKTTITHAVPGGTDIPSLEDTVVPVDDAINVDFYLPGCPPHPSFTLHTLNCFSKGKPLRTNYDQTVCKKCNREMIKTEETKLKRFSEGMHRESICFLSQGYLCLGTVTLDRCFSPCPNKGIICTGCSGPDIRILEEPDRDIRTDLAERMSGLTRIDKGDIIREIEKFSKIYYAYVMASPVIRKKPNFMIKKWN